MTYHEVELSWWRRIIGVLAHGWRCPLQVALHAHPALRESVAETCTENPPDVAVVTLSRLGHVLPALGTVPVVLDLVDALALNMEQRARRSPWTALLWRWEAYRLGRWDRRLIDRSAAATVVAERDRVALVATGSEHRDRIVVLPVAASVGDEPRAWPEREIVVLTGNLGYFPTVDGALWFAREVWPRIRDRVPTAEWWCAGARPAEALRRLHGRNGIRVIADPEHLAPCRRAGRVAIAPILSGSGTPIKVLEAMADGVPMVVTPAAAAGLDAPAEAIAVADDAAGFADAVVTRLADRAIATEQARVARQWLLDARAVSRIGADFTRLLRRVASGAAG
ncbi:MAG: glycosyltransferase family 4 protein [Acidobacteriota bacterium]